MHCPILVWKISQQYKKFFDYMRSRHPQVKHRWSKEYSIFKRLGYEVEHRNMCRACKRTAVSGCCIDNSHATRSNLDIITNIVCVEESLGRDEVAE